MNNDVVVDVAIRPFPLLAVMLSILKFDARIVYIMNVVLSDYSTIFQYVYYYLYVERYEYVKLYTGVFGGGLIKNYANPK